MTEVYPFHVFLTATIKRWHFSVVYACMHWLKERRGRRRIQEE
jgi:hypothetical protein